MTKIYHNPRCSKSRQTLALLEDKNENIEIIKYLDDTPTIKELSEVIKMLQIAPIDLVRTGESIWKEQFKNKQLNNDELIATMVKYPKLIERPIVIKNGKAVLGRPPENVLDIL
ncbi:arsenate reductase (glutaredoxin) [Jejudonia soesokkakensis]|uniref:Arsenate reductase (Glutaredoxin) n=1 Tax=Jejudonia soesokkakensis TaxID=1323432 RepID=A0ABW2MU21_9FLAO